MLTYSQSVLTIAGVCIALGGLYDAFTPRLPANLTGNCADNQQACKVVRELLRALGGSLVAIGATVGILASNVARYDNGFVITLVLILVLPSEATNAVGMYRVRSRLFFVPLSFIALTLVGVALALVGSDPRH